MHKTQNESLCHREGRDVGHYHGHHWNISATVTLLQEHVLMGALGNSTLSAHE